MLNLKRGKGFQKSAANPLLKTLLECRKIHAVHFRSISSRAEKSVLSNWRVKISIRVMCIYVTKRLHMYTRVPQKLVVLVQCHDNEQTRGFYCRILGSSPGDTEEPLRKRADGHSIVQGSR
ncbi:hypothetical protein TNCV_3206751 [Trichonephila clavipes]|nr:hypothetical protein TNCV_3206751 [Trichonephila clavipes]